MSHMMSLGLSKHVGLLLALTCSYLLIFAIFAFMGVSDASEETSVLNAISFAWFGGLLGPGFYLLGLSVSNRYDFY